MELKIGMPVLVSNNVAEIGGKKGMIIAFVEVEYADKNEEHGVDSCDMVHVHMDDPDLNTVGFARYLPADELIPIITSNEKFKEKSTTYDVCTIPDGYRLERHPDNVYLWRPILVEGNTVTYLSDFWIPFSDAQKVRDEAKKRSLL